MRFYRPAIPIIFIFVLSVSIFALPTLATHRPSQEAWLSLSSDEVQSGDTIDFSSRLTGFSCSKRYGTYSMAYTLSPVNEQIPSSSGVIYNPKPANNRIVTTWTIESSGTFQIGDDWPEGEYVLTGTLKYKCIRDNWISGTKYVSASFNVVKPEPAKPEIVVAPSTTSATSPFSPASGSSAASNPISENETSAAIAMLSVVGALGAGYALTKTSTNKRVLQRLGGVTMRAMKPIFSTIAKYRVLKDGLSGVKFDLGYRIKHDGRKPPGYSNPKTKTVKLNLLRPGYNISRWQWPHVIKHEVRHLAIHHSKIFEQRYFRGAPQPLKNIFRTDKQVNEALADTTLGTELRSYRERLAIKLRKLIKAKPNIDPFYYQANKVVRAAYNLNKNKFAKGLVKKIYQGIDKQLKSPWTKLDKFLNIASKKGSFSISGKAVNFAKTLKDEGWKEGAKIYNKLIRKAALNKNDIKLWRNVKVFDKGRNSPGDIDRLLLKGKRVLGFSENKESIGKWEIKHAKNQLARIENWFKSKGDYFFKEGKAREIGYNLKGLKLFKGTMKFMRFEKEGIILGKLLDNPTASKLVSGLAKAGEKSAVRAGVRAGGKLLILPALAMDGYSLNSAWKTDDKQFGTNMARTSGEVAGGWTGFAAGALAGAQVGAMVGSVVPGAGTAVGTLVGGVVGGIIGGMGGSIAGGAIGAKLYDARDKISGGLNKAKDYLRGDPKAAKDNDKGKKKSKGGGPKGGSGDKSGSSSGGKASPSGSKGKTVKGKIKSTGSKISGGAKSLGKKISSGAKSVGSKISSGLKKLGKKLKGKKK